MAEWMIPCNIRYYDAFGAFHTLGRLEWRQSANVGAGDLVYIYVGSPYSSVMFKCRANRVNITDPETDDSEFHKQPGGLLPYDRYMELELLEEYPKERFSLQVLRNHGLKGSIQGPRHIPATIGKLLDQQKD